MKPDDKPDGPEVFRSAWLSRVPDVIAGGIEAQLSTVAREKGELAAIEKRNELEKKLKVIHCPNREGFEELVLKGRVKTPEVKIDKETDRYYLVGVGVPGRQERHMKSRPVKDESDVIAEQVYTDLVKPSDMVIAYTEIDLQSFRDAVEMEEKLGPMVKQGITMFFKTPPTHLTGLLLSLVSYDGEELMGLAKYAIQQKS